MTFYEAAVEVLRRSGRPLHYKKITEIAVREELLSHVGKTPHVTMGERLEREIKKNDDTVIHQERPGVFELDDEYAKKLTEKIREERKKKKRERQKQKTRRRSRSKQKTNDASQEGNQPKRRRSRGSDDGDQRTRKRDRDGDRTSSKQRTRKGQDKGKDGPKRSRSQEGSDTQTETRSAPPSESAPRTSLPRDQHLEEGPVALNGIPRAAYQVLSERDDQSMPIDELADEIFDRDLVKFHTHDPVTTVTSALANDNQVRKQYGHRPLFERDDGDNWSLTEWKLDDEIADKERGILGLSEDIRQATVQQLGGALLDLKSEALEHLALTLLERLGYHNIKVSKRSSEGDVFFTADWRQGLADVRVCVQVATGEKDTLQPDAVHELRETLNHYSASEGVIIHLADVSDEAVEQSRQEESAPVTLMDRDNFVELLLKHGIGVEEYTAPIVTLDTDFIDALRD